MNSKNWQIFFDLPNFDYLCKINLDENGLEEIYDSRKKLQYMKTYKISKIWSEEYQCEVEADSLEEAQKLAEESDEWYEADERWLSMERYKVADIPEQEDDEDEDDYEEKCAELWDEYDWEKIWSEYDDQMMEKLKNEQIKQVNEQFFYPIIEGLDLEQIEYLVEKLNTYIAYKHNQIADR